MIDSIIPPILNSDFSCIVSNDVDLSLIATISSYMNCRSVYYPMFRMPSVKHKKNKMLKISDDDYMSNVIAQKASTLILNSIAKAKSKIIVVVGLDEAQLSYLELERYFNIKTVFINKCSEISRNLAFLEYEHAGFFICKGIDTATGLFIAKKKNMILKINDKAKVLDTFVEFGGNGIVIAERNNDLSDIIITNYAIAIGADIKFINAVCIEEIDDFNLNLLKWKREKSYGGYLKVNNFICESLGDLEFKKYQYATFFTEGIPYGVYFNEVTCCTHVLRSITEDLFIFNNIYYESSYNKYNSSIVFSPEPKDLGSLVVDEADTVETILNNNKFCVRALRNRHATVKAFDQNVSYFPYDILHIVSHGGETTGYYVEQEFIDRNGIKHTIEYEEVVGFAKEDSEYAQVVSKRIFKYLDSLKWKSKELADKEYQQFVYDDMFNSISEHSNKDNTKRVKVDYLIEKSCHVQCYDSIHQGQFHTVASNSSPIIFNNTCSSWKEFSTQLIAAGCRGYIGTLWSIRNEVALNSAIFFYNKVFETTIAATTSEMLRSIYSDDYKDIYLFCGLHFSTISKPEVKSREEILKELMVSLNRWNLYISKYKEKSLILNAINAIKFNCIQLTPFYIYQGVTELIAKSLVISYHVEKLLKSDSFK